jgi:hypothetical protein
VSTGGRPGSTANWADAGPARRAATKLAPVSCSAVLGSKAMGIAVAKKLYEVNDLDIGSSVEKRSERNNE